MGKVTERWEDQEHESYNVDRLGKEFMDRLYSEHGRAIVEAQKPRGETCDGKGNLERYIDVDQTEPVPCPGCVECKPEPDEAEVMRAIWGLCGAYDTKLAELGAGVKLADRSALDLTPRETLSHLRWMLEAMVHTQDAGKLNRWFGFVQGAMWVCRVFTVDQMREHVREALR